MEIFFILICLYPLTPAENRNKLHMIKGKNAKGTHANSSKGVDDSSRIFRREIYFIFGKSGFTAMLIKKKRNVPENM